MFLLEKEGSKKRKRFEQLRKPDICDTVISANETRHKWYKELENAVDDDNDEESGGIKKDPHIGEIEMKKTLPKTENLLGGDAEDVDDIVVSVDRVTPIKN